jgi:hypothetical protein
MIPPIRGRKYTPNKKLLQIIPDFVASYPYFACRKRVNMAYMV